MGMPKHGKESAGRKACAKYKAEGRLILNKKSKEDKIAAGKKVKSRKGEKTIWMKWNDFIRNTPKNKPYCDSNIGVIWGTSKDNHDNVKKTINSMKKGRNKKKTVNVVS